MKAEPTRKLTLDQRANRRLKRLAARRLKAMPLFVATSVADQIEPLPSLQDIKRYIARCQQDVCRRVLTIQFRALSTARHYQIQVAALVSPGQLHRLATKRRIYPPSPDYAADFWRKAYESLVNLP